MAFLCVCGSGSGTGQMWRPQRCGSRGGALGYCSGLPLLGPSVSGVKQTRVGRELGSSHPPLQSWWPSLPEHTAVDRGTGCSGDGVCGGEPALPPSPPPRGPGCPAGLQPRLGLRLWTEIRGLHARVGDFHNDLMMCSRRGKEGSARSDSPQLEPQSSLCPSRFPASGRSQTPQGTPSRNSAHGLLKCPLYP